MHLCRSMHSRICLVWNTNVGILQCKQLRIASCVVFSTAAGPWETNCSYKCTSITNARLLGGLRVTNPTIRLVCPSVCLSVCLSVRLSVCPSVRPSVCLSVNISLVNTITQQILGALIRNLYHGCISGVSWLSSKMDDLDLFLRSRGSI